MKSNSPSPETSFDLIAVGLNAVDVLVRLPSEIKHDDKQFVDDLMIQGGAPVGSGSAGVARMGYRTAFVSRLGDNTLSAICLEEYRTSGVSADLVVRDERSRPAIALVEIDPETSARTVFIQMDNYGYVKPEDVPASEIAAAKVLLVDSYDLDATEAALNAAQGTPCRTVLDFEAGDKERMTRLLALGTDAILPLDSARHLTGRDAPEEAVKALAEMTEGQVIATDGINGSWAWDRARESIRTQAVFPVQAMDSTGCGDAYHAGYIIGLLEGWDLQLRMEMGSLLASRVASQVGGRTALPFRKEADSLLRPDVSDKLQSHLKALAER